MLHPIFNNSDIVAAGWYLACPSRDIQPCQVKSLDLCGQRLTLFRGEDGQVRALDAYCPHVGTDLGLGQVVDNQIRCFFHHWAFDGDGRCTHIPCADRIPTRSHTRGYAVAEQYGFIWVYPDRHPPTGVAEFDDLQGRDWIAIADRPLERNCHHHICMMNGIDAQHLRTIHHLNIHMDLELNPQADGTQIDFTMRGVFPQSNWRERLAVKVLGDRYAYSMRYAHGCVGLLTMMQEVKRVPPLHMIYAYTPLPGGRSRIQPIYLAARRPGWLGWLKTHLLLGLTRWAYYLLRHEDGLIYDHIQFHTRGLLPIDQPLVEYMKYVNQLTPSVWSRVSSRSPQSASATWAEAQDLTD